MSDPTFYCDFCGKPQHEVETLVAGLKTFICDECVALASEVVSSKAAEKAQKIADDEQRMRDIIREEVAAALAEHRS